MASLFHRSRQRRAERAPLTASGNLNLVPLIDVLTSIVFFSLLTYTGAAMAMLTSYDLSLPPTVVTAEEARRMGQAPTPGLLLAVKILDCTGPANCTLRVEHSEEGGFKQEIRGTDTGALDQMQALMTQIRQKYPQNSDVLVVPSDEVSYDTVVQVLERLRMSRFTAISLGARARGQVTSASAR